MSLDETSSQLTDQVDRLTEIERVLLLYSALVYLPAGLSLLGLYGYFTPGAMHSESADLTVYMALFTAVIFFPQFVMMLWNYKKIAWRFQAVSMIPYLIIWLSAWLTNL